MEKDKSSVNADRKEIKGRFKPGTSGNPKGKPKGARHKATLAALTLLQGEAEALTRVCINAALAGDLTALKLCLDRIIPPAKDHPVDIKLPKMATVSDLPGFTGALLDAVSSGKIGPSEAEKICKIVMAHTGAIQACEFEQRIAELETSIKGKSK
ncbi:MAG: hypothetical protein HY881_14460 [Deltaproteobacteria bacterium]|nr:hypothetical protein [Deltaproteobacteria bacterium]